VPTQTAIASFTSFGEMLRYLRRRARLTQRQLGFRVAYTEGHICRLERNQRLPDPATLAALFVPALRLEEQPELASRLIDLARAAREGHRSAAPPPAEPWGTGAIPEPPPVSVAREPLVAELHARFEREPGLAICGVAGVGKTTLVAALAREEARRRPVFWFGLADGVPQSAETLLHRLAAFLGRLGQPDLGAAIEAGHVPLDRLVHLAVDGLAAEPALLCVDNVHLARDDPGLSALVRRVAELGAGRLLLTSREIVAWPPVVTVRVDGLAPAEGQELALRLAPDLGVGLSRHLVERTAGNPMLLKLAAGHLHAHGDDRDRLLDSLATQPEVAGYLLETTLRELSPGAEGLASLLAVLGSPADLHDERLVELAQAAGGDWDWLAAVQELQRRLLVDHPARAALHPLVREHLYARLVSDLPRRRRLHRAAAAWLEEQGAEPLAAAHQWRRAGDVRAATELVCGHAGQLVRRGEAGPAADLAAELEARAARRAGDADLVRRLRVARGDLLVNTARAAEAEAAYRQALALEAPPAAAAIARWKLADCLLQRGGTDEAMELCQAAAAELPPEHALIRAEVAAVASRAHLNRSEHDAAMAAAGQALTLAALVRHLSPDLTAGVEARAHNTIGVVLRLRREHRLARDHLERSARAAEAARLSSLRDRSLFNAAAMALEEGDVASALELLSRLLAEAERCGDVFLAGRVLHGLAYISHLQGRFESGLELNRRAVLLKEQAGDRQGAANSRSQSAMLLVGLGRVREAKELAAGAVAETAATGERWILANHLDTLGTIELAGGDTAAAVRALTDAVALAAAAGDRRQEAQFRLDLALAHLADGDAALALRVAGPRPEPDVGTEVTLTRLFFETAVAVVQHRREDALRGAEAMAALARRSGHRLHELAAARLAAAQGADGDPADLVNLLWAPGPDPQTSQVFTSR
jgi:ATP/maltotriose-dependent transcriptional regulator MalT